VEARRLVNDSMARAGFVLTVSASLFALSLSAAEFDLDKCKKQFIAGEYDEVIETAGAAVKARERGEDWSLLYADALWMKGRYPEARDAIKNSQRFSYYAIRPKLLAYKLCRSAGDLEDAVNYLDEINSLGGSRRWSFRSPTPADLVALGETAVLLGADPKLVLDNFFNPVKKSNPDLREVYLAIGNLALQKHDFALAGKSFQEGLKKFSKDPDMLCGLAEALASDERKEMLKALETALEGNKNHIKARLMLAEHLIDAEEYDESGKQLDKIEAVNPNRPEMWAYRAVIAHLRNDTEGEQKAREAATRFWTNNPEVDYIIGRKLSQKYRFTEGARYQRQALRSDMRYLPAKGQLANDLLRLGQEDEGWRLADDVSHADAYDISAYNLVTLHDTISKFAVLTNEHFTLRMAKNEADVYGDQALQLLEKARATLTKKYGLELTNPVTVEIFAHQKDFAVRTFGMPGGEGYLGVCFGNVITANSPSTHRMNWNSVLWHEFCHVVTLHLTQNKMPRWLSEGISVYEERRADPRWGERLNPKYREFIVDGKMKPIEDLSAAFMAPPSGLYLQFAYFQSSLVVDFLIEKFGLEKMQAILRDLGEGKPINEVLVANTTDMKTLESDFEAFAKGVADTMGTKALWEKPKRGTDGSVEADWASLHPDNYWVVMEKANDLLEEGKRTEAVPILQKAISLYPAQSGSDSAYSSLASIYRLEKQTDKEREVLMQWVKHDDEAAEGLLRLLELDEAAKDNKAALNHVRAYLEINPLQPTAYRIRGEAEEANGSKTNAVQSYSTVLKLDPPDPSEIHFRLARLLEEDNAGAAHRHVLLALEEAPRFRAAHELLLKLADKAEPSAKKEAPALPPPTAPVKSEGPSFQ
jgi:tetratricopeptide (TPR) repeat protein